MTDARISRASVEVLVEWIGSARNSRSSTEVLIQTIGEARISAMSMQYLITKITSTSYADDFDRINNATTPGGLWQVLSGTWGILNNQLYMPSGSNGVVFMETTDTAGLITYVAGTVGQTSVAFWIVDGSNYYRYELHTGNLVKKVANVDTTIATSAPVTADNSVVYVQVKNNGDIKVKQGETEVVSVNEAAATKGTKQGVGNGNSQGKGNHFGWQNEAAIDAAGAGWGALPVK